MISSDVALAVAVHDVAVEQVGHGGEPDMRVRAHVHALAGDELHRAHLVEEDERPDHLPAPVRQRAADVEAVAKVAHPRHDDEFERVAGRACRQARGLCRASSSWNCLPVRALFGRAVGRA